MEGNTLNTLLSFFERNWIGILIFIIVIGGIIESCIQKRKKG